MHFIATEPPTAFFEISDPSSQNVDANTIDIPSVQNVIAELLHPTWNGARTLGFGFFPVLMSRMRIADEIATSVNFVAALLQVDAEESFTSSLFAID